MTSRSIQGIAAALGAVAALAGTAPQVSALETQQAAAAKIDPAATPAAYADYLRHSQEDGAAGTLAAFQRLTPSQQNKFVDYLHDPAVLETLLDKTTSQGPVNWDSTRKMKSTTSLHNGDVSIGQERTVSSGSTNRRGPLPRGNHTATYTTYVKVLGVKVIKLNLAVNFHSNGRDITKTNSAEATKRNLSGVISLSHEKPKTGLSKWEFCRINPHRCTRGHHATASVVWNGEVGFQGSVFQVDKKQWMKANVSGKVIDYYLHNI